MTRIASVTLINRKLLHQPTARSNYEFRSTDDLKILKSFAASKILM